MKLCVCVCLCLTDKKREPFFEEKKISNSIFALKVSLKLSILLIDLLVYGSTTLTITLDLNLGEVSFVCQKENRVV